MVSVLVENGKKVLKMAEYIEREALYEKAYWHGEHPDVSNPFPDGVDAIDIEDVDAIPAADVAPVRHGRWLQKKHKIFGNAYDYVCSECGCDYALAEYNYCPNCGAKMDGVDDE